MAFTPYFLPLESDTTQVATTFVCDCNTANLDPTLTAGGTMTQVKCSACNKPFAVYVPTVAVFQNANISDRYIPTVAGTITHFKTYADLIPPVIKATSFD